LILGSYSESTLSIKSIKSLLLENIPWLYYLSFLFHYTIQLMYLWHC